MMRILLFSVLLFLSSRIFTQPTLAFTPLNLTGGTLDHPVDITGCGDGSGRLFVVEKKGDIRIILNNVIQSGFFLNIPDSVETNGERGLLGMAFHPAYPDSPYVFVNYVLKGTVITRICRFTLNPNNPNDLLETSQKILIAQAGIQSNHKAGDLAFGPDGYLYIGMGDGGGGGDPGENGQNINSLLAKILRIDINVGVPPYFAYPPDNPFVNAPGSDAVWAYGMRNPWRISFDRVTGDFWIGDVGQDLWEEVDFVYAGTPGGMNFGWDCREGNHVYEPAGCPGESAFTYPIFEYPHTCDPPCNTGGGSSMTGGFVYRGSAYPVLYGYYVFADYGSNNVWTLKQTGFGNPPVFTFALYDALSISVVESFGEDDNGELYALSYSGAVYAVSATGTLDVGWTKIKATPSHQGNKIEWALDAIYGINHFQIQRSYFSDFNQFVKVTDIDPDPDERNYHYNDPFINSSGSYYRVAAYLDDGTIEFSPTAHIAPDEKSNPELSFDFNTNRWRISVPASWQENDILLYDLQGRVVYNKKLTTGPLYDLPSPDMPGCYFIIIRGGEGIWTDRIVCSQIKP
ncbi:MAG: PQQ-dependent sugar dehydrogenase [Saprospiraceae bacterium]